ncbi:MAG TPA: pyridoxal-phosphate dependent enzyme [Chloroflexota bacterium]|nr:pyridoxal-phosphate dependent enzyme [Chloroflexota bacterium]
MAYAALRDRDTSVLDAALRAIGMWRWQPLLPVVDAERAPLSLGEGDTPLLSADELAPSLWLKYEGKNPTHSFKDRFQSVAISAALGLGKSRVVCASTGNHGVAAAAYSARAGLECVVLTHEEAPAAHVEAIRQFGATPVLVPPDVRNELLLRLVDAGWYPSTTFWPLPVSNPYGVEGYKTIAFEIFEQLGAEQTSHAHVFVPVGGGDSLYGVFKGFQDLLALGALERLPHVYACQPAGAAPLVAAQASGAAEVPHVAVDRSVALSIRESDTGRHALHGIRTSSGAALPVTDAEIMAAAAGLGRLGLSVDPASAASVAGALRYVHDGTLAKGEPLVCVLTASGARWPQPQGWLPSGARLAASSAEQAYRALVALSG